MRVFFGGKRARSHIGRIQMLRHAHRRLVFVVLDADRGLLGELAAVVGDVLVLRGAHDLRVVLHADAIHKGRDVGGFHHLAVLQLRGGEDDVIDLPLAGGTHGVHQRRRLAINAAGHAVGVGGVVVAVEHLGLVAVHEEHAGVALLLRIALRVRLAHPFEVELAACELLLRPAVAAGDHEHAAVDRPWAGDDLAGFLALGVLFLRLEGVGAGAVKDHDRIEGGAPGFSPGATAFGTGAVDVMHLPLRAQE
jgi:hypothetical protein